MNFDFSDLYRLTADLTEAGLTAGARAHDAMGKLGADITATAQQLVPVDTGATKNSIHWDPIIEPGVVGVEVGPTTEYAPHLEYGTSRMAPHAFMGPALDRHSPAFVAVMGELGADI